MSSCSTRRSATGRRSRTHKGSSITSLRSCLGPERSDSQAGLANLAAGADRLADDVVAAGPVGQPPLDRERAARGLGRSGGLDNALAVQPEPNLPLHAVAVLVDLELGLDLAVVELGLQLRRGVAGALASGALYRPVAAAAAVVGLRVVAAAVRAKAAVVVGLGVIADAVVAKAAVVVEARVVGAVTR